MSAQWFVAQRTRNTLHALPTRRTAFRSDWDRVLMIHFEVDADALQRDVPFGLDLRDGRAFVSLVAFTMRGMRPRIGGKLAAWQLRPIATHEFLNVRTYVRHSGEAGIYFMAEWLSNPLAVKLGPATFGLPYRHGNISYHHEWRDGDLRGCVTDVATRTAFAYEARLDFDCSGMAASFRRAGRHGSTASGTLAAMVFAPCQTGSLTEWLMERYTAFTCRRNKRRFFRVWHPPWLQCEADVALGDTSLVKRYWPWFRHARLIGANFSPGLRGVWMGRPWSAEVTPAFGQADPSRVFAPLLFGVFAPLHHARFGCSLRVA
jgi:uncharacterized protein YqjF (DUF2071 family)